MAALSLYTAVLTPGCQRSLFLHLHRLPAAGRDVVVDALVVVVHRHGQNLLRIGLAHDILVEVSINLRKRQTQ